MSSSSFRTAAGSSNLGKGNGKKKKVEKGTTPPMDEDYNKGLHLSWMMATTQELCYQDPERYSHPEQSEYQNETQLFEGDWRIEPTKIFSVDAVPDRFLRHWQIDGTHYRKSDTQITSVFPNEDPKVLKGRKAWPNTEYNNGFHVKAGVLIAFSNYSVSGTVSLKEMQRRQNKNSHLFPFPNYWSDIVFLQWCQHSRENKVTLRAPRVVLRFAISNQKALSVIKSAIAPSEPGTLPKYPGLSFYPGTEAENINYFRLLACPNAAPVAWMLIQHKELFGDAYVSAIRLFLNEHNPSLPHMELCIAS